jgi:membrane associated rhomboid family serine protease
MTIILLAVTAIISIMCFSNRDLFEKLQFNPYRIHKKHEYYRFISHAFVHADWIHLIVNMIVLFSFGQWLEQSFKVLHQNEILSLPPVFYYLLLYFSSMVVSSFITYKKYRENEFYNAVGASGAVSAVLFACIFFDPWQKLSLYFFIPIPGILFGVLYLWYSQYMSKRNMDNTNHDAHFLGALFGFTFPILLDPRLFYVFIQQLIDFKF